MYVPIYFKDIFLSLGKYFIVTFLGLTFIALIIQINAILVVGINSAELYFDILKLSLYSLPLIIFYITPFAFFIAVVCLLYKYRKDNYIVSLQTLGLSTKQIHKSFYVTATLVIVLHYIVCVCILPSSYKEFKSLQWDLKQKHLTKFFETGIINTRIPDLAIYVDKIRSNDIFNGIFIVDTRHKEVIRVFFATEGSIKLYGSEIVVILRNGSYHQIDNGNSSFLYFDSYSLVAQSNVDIINKTQDPYEMNLLEMIIILNSR